MKDFLGVLLMVLLALAAVVGLGFVGFQMTAYFSPKYEQVRRTTYEQSRAFQEGSVRDLENMQIEWTRATPAQKDALRAVILHRLAAVPPQLLPSDLFAFANQVRNGQ